MAGLLREKAAFPSVGAGSGDPIVIDNLTNVGYGETNLWRNPGTINPGSEAALHVHNQASTSGFTIGVFGEVNSPYSSVGVQGYARAGTGNSVGVEGTCYTASGIGVLGIQSLGRAVVGATEAQSQDSPRQKIGVHGVAYLGTGVFGESVAEGVHGYASGSSGQVKGVFGESPNSQSGLGVEGRAPSGVGVKGSSTTGYGVVGICSGSSQGVVGVTEGVALPGNAPRGVHGLANTGTGVEGRSQSAFGVLGVTQNGVGQLGAFGVEGAADAGTGVAGFSNSGTGAHGQSATGIGIVGLSQATSSFMQGVIGITENQPTPGPAGIGVQGVASTGTGVQGSASSGSGVGVLGLSWFGATCKPMVARGTLFQSANLQEWQDVFANPLAVVSPVGWLGLGTGAGGPARSIHLRGNNACFRMDRDVNSSAFILTRTALGDFSTIWKTFYVGVDASGVDSGLFFIGDRHTGVSGDSDKRLIINNTGLVGVGRTPTTNNLEVEGTASKTTAGGFLANSDIRIKTEIEDIPDALAIIRKLHPVRFRYADSYRAKHPSIKDQSYYNFIAQEYARVFPDSVQDDGEGLLQMDSHNVTPCLVAAVQQLKAEVEEKARVIDELRAELGTMRRSMNAS